MASLIVLEDEPLLCDELVEYLSEHGHDVRPARSVAQFRQQWAQHACDIAVMDLGLPDGEGLDLVRELRAGASQVGIIVLTARAHGQCRIEGFETGADHYLAKPTRLAELLAVVHALARRLGLLPGAGRWVLDVQRRELRTPAGPAASLSAQDYAVLRCLVEAWGRPVPRAHIVRALGEDYLTYDQRRLDSQILRLRRKVRAQTQADLPVRTVHGVGYAFSAEAVRRD